jgi:hypothetical protein
MEARTGKAYATDLTEMEFLEWGLRQWHEIPVITYIVDLTPVLTQRWSAKGLPVLLRRDL